MRNIESVLCTINDVDLTEGIATVKDSFGKTRQIRADFRKGGGVNPRVGDVWVICLDGGQWTFDTLVRTEAPEILGANGGNQALVSLLDIMEGHGFIKDSTTPGATPSALHVVDPVEPVNPVDGMLWTNPDEEWEAPLDEFMLLGEAVATGSSQVMLISSIPQTHKDMLGLVHGVHLGATQQLRTVNLHINGDTGSNYRFVNVITDDDGTPTRSALIGTVAIQLGGFGDDTDLSIARFEIPDYAASRNKAVTLQSGGSFGNSPGQSRSTQGWGSHINNSPITQIQVNMSVENWKAGSVFRIYGIGLL